MGSWYWIFLNFAKPLQACVIIAKEEKKIMIVNEKRWMNIHL